MGFFNSLLIRITLAILGGAFYALLTYALVRFSRLPSPLGISAALFVYLFYLGSRLLLLFSGIDSPYYRRREGEEHSKTVSENSFQDTAQWVGKFYHRHDVVLFVFLGLLAAAFLVSIVTDGLRGTPLGGTIQNLWNTLWPVP